jgi:hypothetical protein
MTRREFRGAAQIPGLKLPGGGGQLKLPIPGMKELDKLLKGEPPLTTSLQHAQPDVPLLDGLTLPKAESLLMLPRKESGAYQLRTGRFYADLQSY